ncbi:MULTISPECIES: hypothetical protein [unclassified Rhizobium]|uniref:hypothetical protein n=1 Tax=unclassified Rhizobium TaxID=2613769 RepID=UPI000CF2AE8D|nr:MULTISPECIES: hypothetical protein [Rhizobium]MDK4737861.1 hypothetical protein [Rhizobium sp. CNPSo 3464]UWU22982.1 hypothetical protein N2601_08565 [Rhizobium tropici]
MTTITYRHTGRTHSSLPPSATFVPFITRIFDRWQQWRSERELESLSDDVRKDIGWPAINEAKNSKVQR